MSETSSSISQITSGTLPIMDTDIFDKHLVTGKWMFVLFYAQCMLFLFSLNIKDYFGPKVRILVST